MNEKYITEFTNPQGVKYGWHIWASSFTEAETAANKRGIGEIVLGKIPHDCADCEWEVMA